MTRYLGDFKNGSTINFLWQTFDKNGASVTRATDGTVCVYKDSQTIEASAGITDTEDFNGLTGIHSCAIDLSSDNFYAKGCDYNVVLKNAAIDGETVNAVLASFSIENRFGSQSLFETAAKAIVNKAVQNKLTGQIKYYDDDGQTLILTHTPTESDTELTRGSS